MVETGMDLLLKVLHWAVPQRDLDSAADSILKVEVGFAKQEVGPTGWRGGLHGRIKPLLQGCRPQFSERVDRQKEQEFRASMCGGALSEIMPERQVPHLYPAADSAGQDGQMAFGQGS